MIAKKLLVRFERRACDCINLFIVEDKQLFGLMEHYKYEPTDDMKNNCISAATQPWRHEKPKPVTNKNKQPNNFLKHHLKNSAAHLI